MSSEKATKHYQVTSPTQIDPNKAKPQDSIETGEKDDDIPELILPPGSPSPTPSTIEMPLNGTVNESSSSNNNYPIHARNNSLETTLSQSMDLPSFILSLELQNQQQNHMVEHGVEKNADRGSHTPVSGSLSLAASQVDISLTNDTEAIQVDSIVDKTDDDSSNVKSSVIGYLNSCGNNNKIFDKHESNEGDNAEKPVLDESTDVLVVDQKPKNFSKTNCSNHDRYGMVHVGNQLVRESLQAGKEEVEKENLQTTALSSISVSSSSKGNKKNKIMVEGVNTIIAIIIGIVLVFNGNGNAGQNGFAKDTIMSYGYDLIGEKYLDHSHSYPWVQSAIDRFQNLCYEVIPTEENSSVGRNKHFSHHSSPFLKEERKNHIDNKHIQETISRVQNSNLKQITVETKNDNDQIDLRSFQSSICLNEKLINDDGTEYPHETTSCAHNLIYEKLSLKVNDASSIYFHQDTSDGNDEKSDSKSDGNWSLCAVLSLVLLFLVSRLISSSPSLLPEKEKFEAKMEDESKVKFPITPTTASLTRSKDSFLTPFMPSKIGSHEPTKWMSPVYGDGAVDVSVYKAMKVADLRELLRNRKCDNRGNKDQMIKMLIQSYQTELACLTVQQLRPKLRKRNLSQKGTKKDVIRRLVEAGPL